VPVVRFRPWPLLKPLISKVNFSSARTCVLRKCVFAAFVKSSGKTR
jgi:hypothetical protein